MGGVNESSPNEIEIKFESFISLLPVLDPLVQGVPEKLELGKEAVKQVKHNWILENLNHSFSFSFCCSFSSILLNSDLALSQLPCCCLNDKLKIKLKFIFREGLASSQRPSSCPGRWPAAGCLPCRLPSSGLEVAFEKVYFEKTFFRHPGDDLDCFVHN